jgi:hypothetical protein
MVDSRRVKQEGGMRSALTIAGLLVALGVGYFVYSKSLTSSGVAEAPPQQTIDVVGIKTHLLNIGQAERTYLAAHGTYGTIEQLQADGPASLGTEQRGYIFTALPNGAQSFNVTATPTDPGKAGWPTLVIDETMVVTQR